MLSHGGTLRPGDFVMDIVGRKVIMESGHELYVKPPKEKMPLLPDWFPFVETRVAGRLIVFRNGSA